MPTVKSIQFLRFVAAALVVIDHAIDFAARSDGVAFPAWVLYLGDVGEVGVHIFFVISGFVMVYTTHRHFGSARGAWRFLVRRFTRIYPIYWTYALAALAAQGLFAEVGQGPLRIAESLLLLPGASSELIFTGWSLSYEVYFYMVFAAVIPLGFRFGFPLLMLFLTASAALGRAHDGSSPLVSLLTSSLLLEFAFGAGVGVVYLNEPRWLRRWIGAAVPLSLVGFTAGIIYGYDRLPSALGWGIPSTLLVLGAVLREKGGHIPTTVERLAWLGDSSYSLYLTHALVLPPTTAALSFGGILTQATAPFLIAGSIPLYVMFGVFSYRWIELPLQRRLPSLRRVSGAREHA